MVKATPQWRQIQMSEARSQQRLRFALLAVCVLAILLGAGLLGGCSRSSTAAPQVAPRTVSGLLTTLEDEVRDLPDGQIAWSTYWKLCWDEYPGAQGYELQTMTGEGRSPKLRRQSGRCFRLQSAAGENQKSAGLVNRDLQLKLQEGQLGYRVRAVLADNRVSEWSVSMPVGKATAK